MQQTVVVGLSGGVDSSVTAYLLKKEGYRVIGLFMKNWHDDEECPWAEDYEDVQRVCNQLEIPFYTVDFSKEYFDEVFSICLSGYEAGDTPNPDILCNQKIKFHHFFRKALALGADFLATGHYAQITSGQLLRGKDPDKDQSYFLYTLKKDILQRVLFPVGNLLKKEVRQIAEEANLATAKKKDSVGICFIGKRKFAPFLQGYLSQKPGPLQTLDGREVGTHEGIAYYTIGQRKGLKIGGKGEAWFVVGKDPKKNIVYVEQGENHPSLYHTELLADHVSWVGEEPQFPLFCSAKIRYRTADCLCKVVKKNHQLFVTFLAPQKAITPRQAIVFYQDRVCLGGATIVDAK